MSTKTTEFKTTDDIRTQAEEAFAKDRPQPVPPTPPSIGRPRVVRVSDAHAWIDVTVTRGGYHSNATAQAHFFIVERQSGNDRRIEGELTPEMIDAFIEELRRAKTDMIAQQEFADMNTRYEKQAQDWERAKSEFARRQVVEWEKEQATKKG